MEHVLPVAGIAVAIVMVVMYVIFNQSEEEPARWTATLDRYRVVWRCVLVGTFLLFLLFLGFSLVPIVFGAEKSFSHESVAIPILVLFFVGVIRLFVERASGEQESLVEWAREFWGSFFKPNDLKEKAKVIQITRTPTGVNNVWIWFFGLSLVFSIIEATLRLVELEMTTFAVYLLPFVAPIGFPCWIYMLLFRKLTEDHHFNSLAARVFLGEIFTNELPRQVMMIGPPASGKSTFILAEISMEPTQLVKTMMKSVFVDRLKRTVTLSMIDCPGEKMRDHVLLASAFRADVLVFTLRVSWFDSESVRNTTAYSLDRWDRLVSDKYPDVQDYLRAFHFATHGDTVVDVSELFKVRSFVLYLNAFDDDDGTTPKGLDVERLEQLAAEMGKRFGVEPEHCFCIAGDAKQAGEARDLLGAEESVAARSVHLVDHVN